MVPQRQSAREAVGPGVARLSGPQGGGQPFPRLGRQPRRGDGEIRLVLVPLRFGFEQQDDLRGRHKGCRPPSGRWPRRVARKDRPCAGRSRSEHRRARGTHPCASLSRRAPSPRSGAFGAPALRRAPERSPVHRRCRRASGPGPRAAPGSRRRRRPGQRSPGPRARGSVPPTVRPVIFRLGWPTPTGTPWPALPQTPMPGSKAKSSPIIATRVSAEGPSPIRVAPLTGLVILAVLDQIGLGALEDELAVGDVHLAAAEIGAVEAALHRGDHLLARGVAGQHAGVGHARHRHVGVGLAPAVAGGAMPISRALMRSCM
jgi:hypothetical protein